MTMIIIMIITIIIHGNDNKDDTFMSIISTFNSAIFGYIETKMFISISYILTIKLKINIISFIGY